MGRLLFSQACYQGAGEEENQSDVDPVLMGDTDVSGRGLMCCNTALSFSPFFEWLVQ